MKIARLNATVMVTDMRSRWYMADFLSSADWCDMPRRVRPREVERNWRNLYGFGAGLTPLQVPCKVGAERRPSFA